MPSSPAEKLFYFFPNALPKALGHRGAHTHTYVSITSDLNPLQFLLQRFEHSLVDPPAVLASTQVQPLLRFAGTELCVHNSFRLNPIASLAWLGKEVPCPLQTEKRHQAISGMYNLVPHTHTHAVFYAREAVVGRRTTALSFCSCTCLAGPSMMARSLLAGRSRCWQLLVPTGRSSYGMPKASLSALSSSRQEAEGYAFRKPVHDFCFAEVMNS